MGFDDFRDHTGTHASQWDGMLAFSGVAPGDGIPMWVADMDFDAAPAILAALQAEATRGYCGYFGNPAPVSQAVCDWLASRHGWHVQPDWIRYSHGVVAGLGLVLEAFSDPGESVILFSPVYHAFYAKARAMGRQIVESELVLRDGRYDMDLDALAKRLTGQERIVILCSPHNPGGRMWTAQELSDLAAFCATHDLILLSDEIHMDLVFPGSRHIPTAVAAPDAIDRLVMVSSPSKGFNIAGAETAFLIIPDATLRDRMAPVQAAWAGTPNRYGMIMMKAAFTGAAEWSEQVRTYLAGNFAVWQDRIGALPGVRVMDMQSTYLAWVDFSGTGMTGEETGRRIREGARIAMSPGAQFGTGGADFHRFNLALPRPRLIEAIERMEQAFSDLQ